MYLKKDKRPNGRLYLSIVKGYRDPKTKQNKQKAVQSIGFIDELEKEYKDPIAHFTEIAKQMTEEERNDRYIELKIDKDEVMPTGTNDLKNLGFIVLSKIYHDLGIKNFLTNRERGINFKYPLNNIMKLLVYERILNPCSKLRAFENKNKYLEDFNFSLEEVYRSLAYFAKHKDNLLLELHENVTMNYGRDTSNVFYDVTNYYFEINEEDKLRRKGMSKDKKGKPIIGMGLLLDKLGIPMTYELFSGNTNDFSTLLPVLDKVKKNFNLEKVIVVADKGLNSGSNKAYNLIKGDGYIFSRSVRGTKADKEMKNYVLDENGYKWIGDSYKIKSRVCLTDVIVENTDEKKRKVKIDEKQIVFFSEKYKRRTQHLRNKMIEKALKLINNPSRYEKAESYGALKYIKGMKVDKDSGNLVESKKGVIPKLDEKLIKEEEKFDGYYSIVTSELDMDDNAVIEAYKGLWKIEESFKITKSTLETRPVYVRNEDSIEAHFLSCFLSLLIIRILEMKTKNKYSVEKLISSLKESKVDFLHENKFKAVFYDEILEHIDKSVGTMLNRKYLNLDDIKKMIAETKK